ncbi:MULTISPECIES: hypothetical protein [unclassified Colwellia]|nr:MULTISPECIES: hypothetical protein [unclassified Colwellia]MBA6347449.1 hypothetical protein [Colwellia sp. BRX8-9]MBA6350797.1 hypothetical protein [Colwellia sp. BRX9-1]
MIKRMLNSILSFTSLLINIKHLSVSQWDIEETENSQNFNEIRQPR